MFNVHASTALLPSRQTILSPDLFHSSQTLVCLQASTFQNPADISSDFKTHKQQQPNDISSFFNFSNLNIVRVHFLKITNSIYLGRNIRYIKFLYLATKTQYIKFLYSAVKNRCIKYFLFLVSENLREIFDFQYSVIRRCKQSNICQFLLSSLKWVRKEIKAITG